MVVFYLFTYLFSSTNKMIMLRMYSGATGSWNNTPQQQRYNHYGVQSARSTEQFQLEAVQLAATLVERRPEGRLFETGAHHVKFGLD